MTDLRLGTVPTLGVELVTLRAQCGQSSIACHRSWLAGECDVIVIAAIIRVRRYEPDVPPSRARVRASIVRHVLRRHGLIAY